MKTKLTHLISMLVLTLTITASACAQDVDFSFFDKTLPLDERVERLVSQMTVEEKISQLDDEADAIPRLRVPDYVWWNEALHGVARNGKATIFPQTIGVAATFDRELIERVAGAISSEARAKYAISQRMGNRGRYAGLTFWSPNVNIFRDPRWGRGQETFGEDPYLTSVLGSAFVNGLQGRDPHYLKAAAAAKHFAVHSGPESIRHHFDAVPNPQDLHETYLPAFEALVTEAGVEGIMPAYNAVFGKPMAANTEFLQGILREQWGFDGYITSDCTAVSGIANNHKYLETVPEAAAAALKAGTNLSCGRAYEQLDEAWRQGLVSEALIHERTKQLFKTRFRLGMFDEDSSDNPFAAIGPEVIHSQEHVALAREAARNSIVLLKNENSVLPLSKETRVPYLTGPFANSADMLMGSYYGVSSGLVTILEGVVDALAPGTSLNYRSGALPFHKNINPRNYAPVVASYSDVTIVVVGLTADREGEEVDAIAAEHNGDRADLKLPQNQIDYVLELAGRKKGPLVLAVASGSPVSLEDIEEHCDAILQIWYPGEQGGNAVADVLFGDYSPSGHLPITFPRNVDQLPPFDDYSMQGRTYKYMTEEPMYPFGFGLSYSETEFDGIRLGSSELDEGDALELSVQVANTGDYDVDEVVQLYVSPERPDDGLPLKSLKAFQRVALAAGETKTVQFSVDAERLKVVNKDGERVWREGDYTVIVGNSSPGGRSIELGAATPQQASFVLQ